MSRRVFITGDKHGTLAPLFGFAEKVALHETDVLIVAGDAGYIRDKNYPYTVETLQQLFPGTVTLLTEIMKIMHC